MFKTTVSARYKTQIRDAATGALVKERPWFKNLVMDIGLNSMARGANSATPAAAFTSCAIGSGTSGNSINSGSTTFTQSGVTITANVIFFTAAMVGGIFKYGVGSGGTEQYISSIGGGGLTCVVSGAGQAVASPTVATVWLVQQTTLQTFLFNQDSYQTTGGSNGSTVATNTITHQRTYVFNSRGAPYTVNEIGWSNLTGNHCFGRAVLGSSDVIGVTNFYVVIIELTLTYSPGVPTAVGNVGTGINTAGNAAVEWWDVQTIDTSGNAGGATTLDGAVSGGAAMFLHLYTATYTQNAGISPTISPIPASSFVKNISNWSNVGGTVGQMQTTFNVSFNTNGETLFGIGINDVSGSNTAPSFDVKLTTPFTLPVGTFNPSGQFIATYSRTLVN